jgi:excisionase family DNA binding protein
MDPLLTIEEIAQILRMSIGTARNRLSRGDEMPPSLRVGRRRLFPEQSLHRWCARAPAGRQRRTAPHSGGRIDLGLTPWTAPGIVRAGHGGVLRTTQALVHAIHPATLEPRAT